ncbi:MAG TPA: hypothetical protein VK498_13870 [Ferruginibacter sp.]|nr:hypothetical protein [Ferruginibacter sp.]
MNKIINVSLYLLFISILLLSSCSKLNSDKGFSRSENSLEKVRMNVASQIEKAGGLPQIFNVYKPVTTQWVDKNKNLISPNNNITSACDWDYPSYCYLVQYARTFHCTTISPGQGYYMQFEYELSWNNNVVNLNRTSVTETLGYIEIKDNSNNIVFTSTVDAIITDLGVDPNNISNEIFHVKFDSPDWIDEAYINGNYTVKVSATFVSDCTSGQSSALWLLPVTTFDFTGDSGNDPCNRNDKVWYQAPGLVGTGRIGVAWNPLNISCFSSPFIEPHLVEVQYKLNNGSWTDFENYTSSGLGIDQSAFIGRYDFGRSAVITSGTYEIGFRYRNWRYILTNPSGTPIPTFPDDCRSFENTSINAPYNSGYTTWAYEYYHGVVI